MKVRQLMLVMALGTLVGGIGGAYADGSGDPAVAKSEDGKYFDKDGNPTFKTDPGGKVGWYTYSGFRRYHSECHVCHGPDGEGSSYAPALANSLKTLSYNDFVATVVGGKKQVDTANNNVMPAFGTNKNVMCYMDDLYTYLRARANNAVPRGRPPGHEPKPEGFTKAEDACMAGGGEAGSKAPAPSAPNKS